MAYKEKRTLFGFHVGVALIVIAALLAVVLGVFWLIWSLWTFVLGSVWPEGPQAIVNPGYWLFICEWILLGMIGNLLSGNGIKIKKGD